MYWKTGKGTRKLSFMDDKLLADMLDEIDSMTGEEYADLYNAARKLPVFPGLIIAAPDDEDDNLIQIMNINDTYSFPNVSLLFNSDHESDFYSVDYNGYSVTHINANQG
jgi:hypothetical protein